MIEDNSRLGTRKGNQIQSHGNSSWEPERRPVKQYRIRVEESSDSFAPTDSKERLVYSILEIEIPGRDR